MHVGIASGTKNLGKIVTHRQAVTETLFVPRSFLCVFRVTHAHTKFKKTVSQNKITGRKERIDTDAT